jgi:EAL domain-containing protein (putative c-di-GMP-specific phosphodiesterase class I)/DICT domain-containing protein
MSTPAVPPAAPEVITTGIRSVYQPIVDLRTGSVVGYEALARGRSGSALERPDLLFAAARAQGLTAELDWACRAAAFEGALAAGLSAPSTLFVNVEPDAVGVPSPARFLDTMARARRGLRAVFEVTERALANNPAELLRVVEDIRAQGWGIALDDVGADWRSLALMPFVQPDVIKLDRHLVQAPLDREGALVIAAIRAYAGRSSAQILAEGIETEVHRQRALDLGATFGQGWMFGRPGPLPAVHPDELDNDPQFVVPRQPLSDDTPVEAIQALTGMGTATKRELVAISRGLERRALDTTQPHVILSAFQTADRFTPATARLYAELASRSAFVGAFGHGMPPEPAPGVRGACLLDNHRLRGEWVVIVVTPHFAGALIARDLGDRGEDMHRRFRYAVLTKRDLVLRAARPLMLKMSALRAAAQPQPVTAVRAVPDLTGSLIRGGDAGMTAA